MPSPIEMPNPLPVNAYTFQPSLVQNITPAGIGFIQTIDRSPTLWTAKFTTPPLDLKSERGKAWEAFIDLLNGSRVPFLAYHPRRGLNPLNYPSGVPGSPVVDSASATNKTLTIHGFPAGGSLLRGDFVSFFVSPTWYLYRITADAVANGSGVITVSVNITPPDISTGAAITIRFARACCAMKMIGQPQVSDKVADTGPTYTIQAAQFVDRT